LGKVRNKTNQAPAPAETGTQNWEDRLDCARRSTSAQVNPQQRGKSSKAKAQRQIRVRKLRLAAAKTDAFVLSSTLCPNKIGPKKKGLSEDRPSQKGLRQNYG
jgi:hypothetical protein